MNFKDLKEFWSIVKLYINWLNRSSNLPTIVKGVGYYEAKLGAFLIVDMQSGKTGIYKCIEVVYFNDPPDMIKNSKWIFIRYAHLPNIEDCSFHDYLVHYCK